MTIAKRILIIEDELPLLRVLRDKFQREGFTVLVAENGQKGLDMALSIHPALILLDIILPELDGMEVLERIHADVWGKDARVIMLTNSSDSQKVTDAIALGAHDFLVKADWKIEDVVRVVRHELQD